MLLLSEGYLAHFISDTVNGLDLKAFHARYEQDNSRKITRKLHEDVVFRVLTAGNFLARRTIRDSRASHLQEFSELFVRVVRLARELGPAKPSTADIDGAKVKADACHRKLMSYGHIVKAEAELAAQIKTPLAHAARPEAIRAVRGRLEQCQREQDRQARCRVNNQGSAQCPRGGVCKRPFDAPKPTSRRISPAQTVAS